MNDEQIDNVSAEVINRLAMLADWMADEVEGVPQPEEEGPLSPISRVAQEIAGLLDEYEAWGIVLPDGRRLGHYEEDHRIVESFVVIDNANGDDAWFGKIGDEYYPG